MADLGRDRRRNAPSRRCDCPRRPREGLFIPPGVAHGFLAVTDLTLGYLVDRYFDGSDEWGIAWNDPELGIDWPATDPVLSDRDREQSQPRRRRSGTRSLTAPTWVDLSAP